MNGTIEFRIEILDPAKHRREEFDCGIESLTTYLRKRARKEMESRTSVCFVLVPLSDPGHIAGYYTLSATAIELARLPGELSRRLPRYPEVPATLLGRLARDSRFKGMGVGPLLMRDALQRAWEHSAEIGSVAVVTDPKDAQAADFYRQFGFRHMGDRRMLLPMGEIERWLKKLTSG
jgi:ribosomal protein S18 acetylase RimI-like enzyme